jgi:hypothetical protein
MQIFVQVHDRAISLDLDEELKIEDVKKQACDTATLRDGAVRDPDSLELLNQGNALLENKSLKENGINPGDMLELYKPIDAQ